MNCESAATTGNSCSVCKTGFGLVTGGCVAGNTPNCATYNTSTALTAATCQTCNVGFYLTSTKTCEPGVVAHCTTHTSIDTCSLCETGYFKVAKNLLSNDAHDYCYKFDESLNCDAVTITNYDNGAKFSCTNCSVGYSVFEEPSATTEIQTNCLSHNLIDNCDTYNLSTTLVTSTLLCQMCKTGYYSVEHGSSCVKRTVIPVGCKTYQSDADLCQVCNDGNFLTTNMKECTAYPSGVIGCSIYSDATTCTSCSTDRWLNEGVCTDVLTADKVANCLLYSNSTTCSVCQDSFFLEGNACVTLNVNNCAQVASKDACESCLNGFRLKTDNGKTTCESFTKPNCITYEQNGTNPCTLCSQNFYIDANGDCAAVSPIIINCLFNETKETCKMCAQGFALAKDAKTCVDASSFDTNCTQVVMPANMSCSECSPGYYFKNGVCTAFTGKSISDGCFSQNLDVATECLLCNTGYYMNSSLNCVKVEVVTPFDPNPIDNNTKIVRSLIMMFLTVIFMF